MSAQQNLFDTPKPMHICSENGHNYEVAGEGYYKYSGTDEDGNTIQDKNRVFRVLFCNFCGSSVEICVVDRTPLPQPTLPTMEKKTTTRRRSRAK